MCAHMRVWWKKVHKWTLILAPPPREELALHLVDILFHSGIKVDFTEAWGGIQRGSHTEKMRNDARLLESPGYARRSAEEMENCELFFMHHKCNII